MAIEYPKYDWRGIAMLTEQVGKLLAPNELEILDKKQTHEANILMAEQAWKMETAALDMLIKKHEELTKSVNVAEKEMIEYGMGPLARASSAEGSTPDATAKMFETLETKTVQDKRDLQLEFKDMITKKQEVLNNYFTLNETAKLGSNWSKTWSSPQTDIKEGDKGVGRDYKSEFDLDKAPGLSWEEQNNAVTAYLNDYYISGDGKGTNINVGGKVVEDVTPEGQAFYAGFNHTRRRDVVDKPKEELSGKETAKDHLRIMRNTRKTLDQYHQRGLDHVTFKDFTKDGYIKEGFAPGDYDVYASAGDVFKQAYKKYISSGEALPDDLIGRLPINNSMFHEEEKEGIFSGLQNLGNEKQFAKEGLNMDKYLEIVNSDNKVYRDMAINIVYNWDDIINKAASSKANDKDKKAYHNMLKALELLKREYKF